MSTHKKEAVENTAAIRKTLLGYIIEWEKVDRQLKFQTADQVPLRFARTMAEIALKQIRHSMATFGTIAQALANEKTEIVELKELEAAADLATCATATPSDQARIVGYSLQPIYAEPGREDYMIHARCALTREIVSVPVQSHNDTVLSISSATLLSTGGLVMSLAAA